MGKPRIIGVHDGPMHSDEVFAVAALSMIMDVDIVRTRDPEILKTCDMRVDVGDNYNHQTKDYDHHMQWFNVRHQRPFKKYVDGKPKEFPDGPLRSGFGLIWLHYGKDIIMKVLTEIYTPEQYCTFEESDFLDLFEAIDNGIVAYIDACDNGEQKKFLLNVSPFRNSDITKIVAIFNPTIQEQRCWVDANTSEANYHRQFMAAMNIAKLLLRREIASQSELLYFRRPFMKLIAEMPQNEEILVLDQYIPWSYAYGRAGSATNGVEMIVYPAANGNWMCQTPYYYFKRDSQKYPAVMKDGSPRQYKHQAPVEICALRDQALCEATGIADLSFVHKGGHLGVAKTKEAAIALAQYFIDHSRQ